jgi:hypothetical protein
MTQDGISRGVDGLIAEDVAVLREFRDDGYRPVSPESHGHVSR